jgi:hypothetical protein
VSVAEPAGALALGELLLALLPQAASPIETTTVKHARRTARKKTRLKTAKGSRRRCRK